MRNRSALQKIVRRRRIFRRRRRALDGMAGGDVNRDMGGSLGVKFSGFLHLSL